MSEFVNTNISKPTKLHSVLLYIFNFDKKF
jgi:hypothetical protein